MHSCFYLLNKYLFSIFAFKLLYFFFIETNLKHNKVELMNRICITGINSFSQKGDLCSFCNHRFNCGEICVLLNVMLVRGLYWTGKWTLNIVLSCSDIDGSKDYWIREVRLLTSHQARDFNLSGLLQSE